MVTSSTSLSYNRSWLGTNQNACITQLIIIIADSAFKWFTTAATVSVNEMHKIASKDKLYGMERLTQRNSEHNSWGNQYRRTFQHLFPENNLNIARRNKLVDLYMPMYLQVCLKFSNRLSLFFMSFSIFFTFRLLMVFHLRVVYFFGTAS